MASKFHVIHPDDTGAGEVIRTLCGRELINGTGDPCKTCETRLAARLAASAPTPSRDGYRRFLATGQQPGTDGPVRFRAPHGKRKSSCLRRGWR